MSQMLLEELATLHTAQNSDDMKRMRLSPELVVIRLRQAPRSWLRDKKIEEACENLAISPEIDSCAAAAGS